MSEYRIVIDRERCVGDGLCREAAGGTFDIDEERRCTVSDPEGDAPEDVLFAAWNCPSGCIDLYADGTGKRVWPCALSREQSGGLAQRRTQEMDLQTWGLWRDLGGGD